MLKCLPILLFLLMACGEKKKTATGIEQMKSSDFIDAFSKLKLPYNIADTNLSNVFTDTTTVSLGIFSKFIPDSSLSKVFNADRNMILHPVGKYEMKGKETYLVVHAATKKKAAVYLIVFDKNKNFSISMPLVQTNEDESTLYSAAIDNRLTISMNKEWKMGNDILYNRIIYAYNNVGTFTVVMTETNDQSKIANNIFNPIDTLSRKFQYSGDYAKDKKSVVSIRDGKKLNTYLFFVHFENDNEEPCKGELRGDFAMNSPNTAVFTENSDPCVIDFTFKANTVEVKEQGSCGSHRGIKCFFNDTYTKKKEPKAPKKTNSRSGSK